MKGIFRFWSVVLVLSGLLSSCGTKSRRSRETRAANSGAAFVSRAEYDNLKWRYEQLLAKTGKNEPLDTDKLTEKIRQKYSGKQVSQDMATAKLAETVDVFSTADKMVQTSKVRSSVNSRLPSNEETESQVVIYQRAQKLFDSNKLDAALAEAKKIEGSEVKQVRVHARFLIGEIMFKLNEYDVATQMYKEILLQDAFSGLVLKSLEKLIVCSEKLNLPEEKQRYQSILNSFMES